LPDEENPPFISEKLPDYEWDMCMLSSNFRFLTRIRKQSIFTFIIYNKEGIS